MSSAYDELKTALEQGRLVTVCWEPDCHMHRLSHWAPDEWILFKRRPRYTGYTHSICQAHARLFEQKLEQYLAAQHAAKEEVLEVA